VEENMKVKDVMHRGSIVVEPTTPIIEVAKRMRDVDVGAIPVTTDGHLVGIVTDRDITCRALARDSNVAKVTAEEVMTRDVAYCSPEDDVDLAIEIMERRSVRRLPVADSHRALVGMLSLGDISHKVGEDTAGEVLRAVSAHHA
jgi:CBS domain-containing protein